MHSRAVQVILLLFSLVLAIVILIASSKYAAWSKEMTKASGSWLPLVFYIGTVPLLSLVYTATHLAALQFNGIPCPPYPDNRGWKSRSMMLLSSKLSHNNNNSIPPAYDAEYTSSTTFFILAVSILHSIAWFAQCILCTACELAPILAGTQGNVPKWCPQSRFQDTRQPGLAGMLGTLAAVKDFLQWAMLLLSALLIECARREYMRAERVRNDALRRGGAGVDFGGGARGGGAPWNSASGSVAKPASTVAAHELTQISGPRLFRHEEEVQQQQQKTTFDANRPLPSPPESHFQSRPQPQGPGAPGNRDNYYGNGMGLKRSGTLNYMYESRV